MDYHQEVRLSDQVETMIEKICVEKSQPPLKNYARIYLAKIGDDAAIDILTKIATSSRITSFGGFVGWLVENNYPKEFAEVRSAYNFQPSRSPSSSPGYHSPQYKNGEKRQSPVSKFKVNSPPSSGVKTVPRTTKTQLSYRDEMDERKGFQNPNSQSPFDGEISARTRSLLQILDKLEFRKLFLVLSYIGRQDLESVMTLDDANGIISMKDKPMKYFESIIWNSYGKHSYNTSDRSEYSDWDSGKMHSYHCYVNQDGKLQLKGPYLSVHRTAMHDFLGDENILTVKFRGDGMCGTDREGILVGLRRFRFFVFKDERKRKKKNLTKEKKESTNSDIKCYFAGFETLKEINEARRLFMHLHTVPTIEKQMARLSLILSKTIKLQVDLNTVEIETIEDIPLRDGHGSVIYQDGKPVLHTDGTGYISEDLAMLCPKDFCKAQYMKDDDFEKLCNFKDLSCLKVTKAGNKEPPLLIQCRLFHNGLAVKGTLLVNRKLGPGKIQIRPSMIKVDRDSKLWVETRVEPAVDIGVCRKNRLTLICILKFFLKLFIWSKNAFWFKWGVPKPRLASPHLRPWAEKNFSSLEIVSVSHKPGRAFLSRYLIAHLTYGGVPGEFFLNLVSNALEEAQNVYSDWIAALKVASYNEGLDYGCLAQRMILSGIPLSEPYLQQCLSRLVKEDKSKLKTARIPMSESFYLMGTADPTCKLNNDEVCVILENGQLSGKVLVYRNPGLHFGDVHILNAVYVEELQEYVGNAKFGIFFSVKGGRSAAYEMAKGDFDGDMYWVSRNPELLEYFHASKPWSCEFSAPNSSSRNPKELSEEELECEFFCLLSQARKPSYEMANAADSWLAYVDRLLILPDDSTYERDDLMRKIKQLVDIYYETVDAPKSGKDVKVPNHLKAKSYPHHMEKGAALSHHSNSILGQIYDKVEESKTEILPTEEITILPCFDVEIPEKYLNMWKDRYDEYRMDMKKALSTGGETKNAAADDVIKKYKQLLYDAPDMAESEKKNQEIEMEALAIYHVTYEFARKRKDIGKCKFAWSVAGDALCNLHSRKRVGPNEKPLIILSSRLRDLLR